MISDIQIGDTITMHVNVKRKWYQVWKPRWSKHLQAFKVVGK